MAVLEVTGREAADPIAAIELCYSQGWTDGLPVVPRRTSVWRRSWGISSGAATRCWEGCRSAAFCQR